MGTANEIHFVDDTLSDGTPIYGVFLKGDSGYCWIVCEDRDSAQDLYNILDASMVAAFVSNENE